MKNLLLVLLTFLIPHSIFSQNLSIGKWKVSKFGISFGVEQDMIKGIDGDYLIATAKDVEVDIPEGMSFITSTYAMVCENPNIQAFAVLEVPNMKNTELQLGANIIIGRLDEVFYTKDGSDFNDLGKPQFDYLSISSFTNEIGLEVGLSRRFSLSRLLSLYLGANTNIGLSYHGNVDINGSDLSVVNSNKERSIYDVYTGNYHHNYNYYNFGFKKAFHQRLNLQATFSVLTLKRFELGFFMKGGIGYKNHFNGPKKNTHLQAAGFSVAWLLKDK